MALAHPLDSLLLPLDFPLPKHHPFAPPRRLSFSLPAPKFPRLVCSASAAPHNSHDENEKDKLPRSSAHGEDHQDVDRALHLDGRIPPTSDGFLEQVSSRPYDMRRKLEQSIDASSYDVLEANPWREDSKSVYVLAQEENKLLTMRTRRARSEVENELNLLFPKRGNRRGMNGLRMSSNETRFRMVVEDVREGVLVFEDEEEASRYCSLLDGQGKGCMGVAELDASDVFALCQKIKALAVLFRRGRTPPLPERLQLNLKARKHSLED